MGFGSSAPSQDPRMGEAALKSAEIGEDYLEFMRNQASITNQWASSDRQRYLDTFRPLEDDFISEAQNYDNDANKDARAAEAVADVRNQMTVARAAEDRRLAAMGVNPASGRSTEGNRRMATDEGLASAGAANMARRQVEDTGRQLRAGVVNLGQGMAVNPGTSMSITNSTAGQGFQGAMQGQNQMAGILNTDYQNRRQSWRDSMGMWGGLAGGVGQLVGAAGILSSKEVKKDKKPASGHLERMREIPVEEWTYKDGHGDGERHVGPYAEDFAEATGRGDGRSISVIDAIGESMGAIKELDQKVSQIERAVLAA